MWSRGNQSPIIDGFLFAIPISLLRRNAHDQLVEPLQSPSVVPSQKHNRPSNDSFQTNCEFCRDQGSLLWLPSGQLPSFPCPAQYTLQRAKGTNHARSDTRNNCVADLRGFLEELIPFSTHTALMITWTWMARAVLMIPAPTRKISTIGVFARITMATLPKRATGVFDPSTVAALPKRSPATLPLIQSLR